MRLHYFGLCPESINRRLKLSDVDDMLVSLERELQRTIEMLRDDWHRLAKQIKKIDLILVDQGKNDPLDAVSYSIPGIATLIARVLTIVHPGPYLEKTSRHYK
jgi:hypothetical protein